MPGGYVCSASFKAAHAPDVVKGVYRKGEVDPEALHETAACVLQDACPGGSRARRPLDPRPDLRAQAQVQAEGVAAEDGGGAVALPGRIAHPRAVDEVRAQDALNTVLETRLFLEKKGVDLGGEQQTKTKTALEFFAKELEASVE